MPEQVAPSPTPPPPKGTPLTIPEAKLGLSLTFNVPPEAIDITIRG